MKLTLPQQDVYFEQLLYPNEPIYNIGAKIKIKGQINHDAFQKAYIALIDQHDSYRSILTSKHENVRIKIVEDHNSALGFVDFSPSAEPFEAANVYMQEEFAKPFDLFGEHLLHVFTLVKVQENFHYLFSVYHHIITDGWGTSLMFQRLVQNYNEILEHGKIQTVYPFSYKDFAVDDAAYQQSESYHQDKIYWTKKFESLPQNLFDKLEDNIQINESDRKELIIKREVYNQLNSLAVRYKCSTFNVILAILYAYFGRKHQNNDFAIGLPVLNRSKASYKKTVGLFMGVSPLRISIDFNATFENLIAEIKTTLRHDYRHQRFPLGKLIQELQVFNEKERLFNITLSYEKQNYSNDFLHTHTQVIPLTHKSERVALAIYIREFDEDEDVKIDFDYNLNYFTETQITQVVHHFENLVHAILDTPDQVLKELNYLGEDEKRHILETFNTTKVDYQKENTILDVFQDQVIKFSTKEALKDNYKSYTYAELDQLSGQIAEYLIINYGQEDKSPIAVLLGRSANIVIVLLGILKAGRAYIPLDPSFPGDRLNYIIENSQIKLLINEKGYVLHTDDEVQVLSLETILEKAAGLEGKPFLKVSPHDTAYILYTSGSTGNPKGVEIGHQSLLNFLSSMQQEPGVRPSDVFFSVTTYSFDISILEFFVPLLSGAALYIANQEILGDPEVIIQKIEEIQPTIIQATPSFYQMLFNADWNGDKRLKVLCGGDLLSEALAEKLISHSLEVWNMYGPTETTIWSSLKKLEHAKEASNIGKPIHNTQIYILDSFLSPKPIGTPGAIYIAGDGLAKGYYKNTTLTQEKFIKNPFQANGLLYETGDVGRWNDKGEIEFLGRNDNQVKIRGYRIELGDIESHLNQISGIKESVVIAKKGNQQEAFLVAYVVKMEEMTDTGEIVATLKRNLPYYMIPGTIVLLKEFPLTPNQKIDRKSLAQRAIEHHTINDDFKAPESDLEKKLAGYWKEILNSKKEISTNDNFFALGGHSLNAVKLAGSIAKNLGYDVNLKTVFDYPTIRLMADYLVTLKTNDKQGIPFTTLKTDFAITPSQQELWVACQDRQKSIAYNMVAVFEINGTVFPDKINNAMSQLIFENEILRTNFVESKGAVFQKIGKQEDIDFKITQLQIDNEQKEQTIQRYIETPFDLEQDVLVRMLLVQTGETTSSLVFCTHHIIMDGVSLEFFTKEFIQKYNHPDSVIKNSGIQFKDYTAWLASENDDKTTFDFWQKYLDGYSIKETINRDFNLNGPLQNGAYYDDEFTIEDTKALKKFAQEQKSTLYNTIISLLNVLIHKINDHKDIVIGTVNAGRNNADIATMIGMFVKTLPLRVRLNEDISFLELLKQVQEDVLLLNTHQDFPSQLKKETLFDVLISYQNPDFSFQETIKMDHAELKYVTSDTNYSRFPLLFNFFESGNTLKVSVSYDKNKYEEISIQFLLATFKNLWSQIIENPSVKVSEIEYPLVNTAKLQETDFDFNF
ncbi:amino acid adenylation domain-containing protein [Flavobacterium sp. B183]|uniref:amino acid adenylation domain-containing protein n=1 Tax=Flavobacterium sp. B183 TaxID=907046 RepID=UPI00201EF74C|nr:amino acid adenylation domain-containing protein [Flavobacterium sp. B183]URC12220.1 amino acid adenylation domain-containing protein [Flavobacterium sp. B183]